MRGGGSGRASPSKLGQSLLGCWWHSAGGCSLDVRTDWCLPACLPLPACPCSYTRSTAFHVPPGWDRWFAIGWDVGKWGWSLPSTCLPHKGSPPAYLPVTCGGAWRLLRASVAHPPSPSRLLPHRRTCAVVRLITITGPSATRASTLSMATARRTTALVSPGRGVCVCGLSRGGLQHR